MNFRTVGELITKAKVEKCGEGTYPVLSMTMHEGIVFQDERFKKQIASVDQSTYNVVRRNQLVVSFPIDEGVLAVQDIADAGIVSPAYKIWDVDQAQVVPKYLEMFLRSPHSIQYYKSKLRGSTARRRSITDADLLKMIIPLGTKDEQASILKTLEQAKRLIKLRKRELAKLDDLVKARFVEVFGDPRLNPNGYPVHQLSEYIEFLTSGSRGWAQYCSDDGREWFITIKTVKDCRISDDNMQPINAPDNAEAKRTRVQEGDLLISITADLGRTGVVTKEIAEHGAYINQHLTCIRLNREVLEPLYVAHFMESSAGKEQFISKNQSAVKAGLNFNSINTLRLLVPPKTVQQEFLAFVSQIDKSKLHNGLNYKTKQGLAA